MLFEILIVMLLISAFRPASLDAAEEAPAAQAGFLEEVAKGYEQNRAKFSRGRVRFALHDGFADDAESARAGKLRDACIAVGEYAFNIEGPRPDYRYSKEFSAEDLEAHTKRISGSQTSTHLYSFRALSNGELTLFDHITWQPGQGLNHSAQIEAGGQPLFSPADFPYELGFPEANLRDMSRQIRSALAGEDGASVGSVEEAVALGGRALSRFTLKLRNGEATYLVDAQAGWLPLEKRSRTKDGGRIDVFYDDFRNVPGRGSLPFVKTTYLDGAARRLVIEQADFDSKPGADAFSLDFPEPRGMVNAASGVWYRSPRKTWSLASLPRPSAAGVQKLGARRGPGTSDGPGFQPAGEREPSSWFGAPLAIGIGCLAAAALAARALRRAA